MGLTAEATMLVDLCWTFGGTVFWSVVFWHVGLPAALLSFAGKM
jgi:hypothetical protein